MSFAAIAVARRRDASAIALMSRELIEAGLAWSWTPERVARAIASRHTIVAVARSAYRLAGFGIMRYGDDDAHLDLFAVAYGYRRQGLGRRLLEWLEKPALVAGIADVTLEVRAANRGARAFYESSGYRQVEALPGYYQGREAAIRMRRRLGSSAHREPFDSAALLAELLGSLKTDSATPDRARSDPPAR